MSGTGAAVAVLRLAPLNPMVYTVAVLGQGATAVVLLWAWRLGSDRRSALILGLTFAATAITAFLAMLTLPMLPSLPPILAAPSQTGVWLSVFWHTFAAVGALAYIVARRRDDAEPASRRFALAAVTIVVVVVAGAAGIAFSGASWLPVLVTGTTLHLVSSGVAPLAGALLALATLGAFRLAQPSAVERALAFSLALLTLETTTIAIGGHWFTASFYLSRIFFLAAAIVASVAAERALLDARSALHRTEREVTKLADEASKRAGRFRALWEIAQRSSRPAALPADSILKTATAAIRPGKPMFGTLSHLDGQTVVIDEVSWSASPGQALRFMDVVYPGARFKLKDTMSKLLLAAGGTCMWNDFTGVGGNGLVAFDELAFRSLIGTTMTAGQRQYFLTFGSLESMHDQPFAEDDEAYVDVVASFFETRFSEELQFERLLFQMEHDALTGLENRIQFRKAIRRAIVEGMPFVVALVNLDGFRLINEMNGQMIGDELLVEVAVALSVVNPKHLVTRLNGDEFGILMPYPDPGDLAGALERYLEPFRQPFYAGQREAGRLRVSASLGASAHPAHGESPEELIRRADVALELAKDGGGARAVMFDPAMDSIIEQRRAFSRDIERAVAEDQLRLMYQPTFDLRSGLIVGAEALIRWDHPERGEVMPVDFIPIAERNNYIGSISSWVLARVVRDIVQARDLPSTFRVYFNLSAQNLDDLSFLGALNDTLADHPELAHRLGVEITETTAMQNVEQSLNTLGLIRSLGLRIAIDDFGTGYSSLSYLKRLPVDLIKIDRSFISGLPDDGRDAALAESMIGICGRFTIASLAEGIETREQHAWLLEHGCRLGQGYLFDRPLTFDTLLARLAPQRVES